MSASEDSEVSDAPDVGSNIASTPPAQVQNIVQVPQRSSMEVESVDEPELPPYIENDHESDESFLPDSDNHQVEDDPRVDASQDSEVLHEAPDAFAAEGSYLIRQNRYYGPASTWRGWTKNDRGMAESLDQDRAQDLSIHLYNAHVLRLEAQNLKEIVRQKRRRGTSETDDVEDGIFEPPRLWTAWPTSPQEVPRDYLNTSPADNRPSRDLEECLIALTTKGARERWNARDWLAESALKKQRDSKYPPSLLVVETLRESLVDAGQSSVMVEDNEGGHHAPATDYSTTESDMPKMQMFSSQAVFDNDASSEKDSDNASEDDAYTIGFDARPVPLADDDRAHRLLIPSTRHVVSKLDDLLMGLHRTRQAYAALGTSDDDDSVVASAIDTDGNASAPQKQGRGRPRKRQALSETTSDSEVSAPSSAVKRTKNMRARHSKPQDVKIDRLGLRGWTDVLGIAALTGWDESVVERASMRCAELFGQNMLFRTFHEGEQEGEKSYFTEHLATGGEPIERKVEDENHSSATESEASKALTCPFETCPWHTKPFKRRENLRNHLKRFHLQSGGLDNEEGITNGPDILCPVETCHRHRDAFTKGSKLYAHIRRMHPEVNVEKLKRLEAQRRGETRGKWSGEKRMRNPYER